MGEPGAAKRVSPEGVSILKSLVGVDVGFLAGVESVYCRAEAVGDRLHARRGPRRGRDDSVVVEIKDGREIDLRGADGELGDVRDPLGVAGLCGELAVQDVVSCFTDLSSEGVVAFAAPDRAVQAELTHELQDGSLRHRPSLTVQDGEDATVPIRTLHRGERVTDRFFDTGPGVWANEPTPVVVER